jgi:iron complex outermembrane receptor protein
MRGSNLKGFIRQLKVVRVLAYTVMGLDQQSNHLQEIPTLSQFKGHQPQHTASLRSSIDVADNIELDFWLRYVSSINPGAFPNTTTPISAYLTLDARLAWQVTPKLELSLVGRNLLAPQHPEFANNFYMPYLSEIERSVYVKATLKF